MDYKQWADSHNVDFKSIRTLSAYTVYLMTDRVPVFKANTVETTISCIKNVLKKEYDILLTTQQLKEPVYDIINKVNFLNKLG